MDKNKPIAYLICGFIGAGKTTFARKLEKETAAVRITKDEWIIRIFGNAITTHKDFEVYDKKTTELATDIGFRILSTGKDVIFDEGYWTRYHREEIVKRVTLQGAKPVFYYVECEVETMRQRVMRRSNNPPPDAFEITGKMFDGYLKYWEPPTNEEDMLCATNKVDS